MSIEHSKRDQLLAPVHELLHFKRQSRIYQLMKPLNRLSRPENASTSGQGGDVGLPQESSRQRSRQNSGLVVRHEVGGCRVGA
jgi:hypothetical protein